MLTTPLTRSPLAAVATFAHGEHPHVDPEEERFARPTVVFTTHGAWGFHGRHGRSEATPDVVVLGHAGEAYRCRHASERPTDRTTFVTFDHERLGYDPLPERGTTARTPRLDAVLSALVRADEPLLADTLVLRLALELRGAHEPPQVRTAAVAAARELLEESVETGITLVELARAVHLSPFHLARSFREQVGVPPHEYLLRLRIRRAAELLAAGASVTETASATGFSSSSHLATTFRRRVGVSPSTYRRSPA